MLSGSAPAMADAKIILSRKLASDWSSPELAQILEQRPGFYEEVSRVFSKLEKAIKVRRREEGGRPSGRPDKQDSPVSLTRLEPSVSAACVLCADARAAVVPGRGPACPQGRGEGPAGRGRPGRRQGQGGRFTKGREVRAGGTAGRV